MFITKQLFLNFTMTDEKTERFQKLVDNENGAYDSLTEYLAHRLYGLLVQHLEVTSPTFYPDYTHIPRNDTPLDGQVFLPISEERGLNGIIGEYHAGMVYFLSDDVNATPTDIVLTVPEHKPSASLEEAISGFAAIYGLKYSVITKAEALSQSKRNMHRRHYMERKREREEQRNAA